MKPDRATTQYAATRAKLTRVHTSLRKWAMENGFPISTTYAAASGQRHGARARAIRAALVDHLAD